MAFLTSDNSFTKTMGFGNGGHMPVNMLENERRQYFGKYAEAPSKEQLRLYFQLSYEDKLLIENMRLPSTKLGFAVQLSTVRFLGTFITNFNEVPPEVLEYLAHQLDVEPNIINLYNRQPTQFEHTKIICEKYGYQRFTAENINTYLTEWLIERSIYTTETYEMLFDMLLKKCLDEKILLPGVTTFERFIAKIIESSEKELHQKISDIPSPSEKIKLLELLEPTGDSTCKFATKMDALRAPLIDESQKEITRGFNRLVDFESFNSAEWDFSSIPEGKLKSLSNYAFKAKAFLLRRMDKNKKLAHIIAFVHEYRKKAMDEQLLALSKYFDFTFRKAKNLETKERMRTLKDLDKAAIKLYQIVEVLFDENVEAKEIRETAFALYPKAEVASAISQVKNIIRNEQEPIAISELLKSFRRLKRFIPQIILTIDFESNQYGEKSIAVWSLIKERFPKPITTKLYKSIEENIPRKWQHYIKENPSLANTCVLIAGVELIFQGLKKHDIFVNQSEKYIDPTKHLLDNFAWKEQRSILVNQLLLPDTGALAVKELTESLALSFMEAQKNWDTFGRARIEDVDGKQKIVITKLKKSTEHKDEKEFKARVRQLMPSVDLPDLLLEVNQRLGLTQSFSSLSEGNPRMENLDISIMAVLLAEACNVGFSSVSKENIECLKLDRLSYVDNQYLRIDTLNDVNIQIVQAYSNLGISLTWGNNEKASADGIRYTVPQRSLYSYPNPKYFGRGRGITFYNFVSDQYIGFHGMVVSGTIRDSLYLLEGLLNQRSGLNPYQIMTDTAGYSDLVFGLFALLGFQFSPRIADRRGTKLWRIEKKADYGILNSISMNQINIKIIQDCWEDVLRVACSLKSGKINAVELTRALQRDGHPTSIGKAIAEYGKVYKTKHQLRYITDETYARQILEQLNKGEARHALCRNIFYGKKGKLYQTYFDGMEEQLSSLGVVTNAIIYWNALYLEKVLEQMKTEGYDCSEELICKLSPLLFEHINFVGKYSFQYNQDLEDGSLRPLNF